MPDPALPDATVYTETVVHSAPERYSGEVPYQIAIVEFADATRRLVRISSTMRVQVGSPVRFIGFVDGGIPLFELRT